MFVNRHRSAPDRIARAQARGRLRARHAHEVGPHQRAPRAVGIRARLDAREADDRNGRAALHAAHRLRRSVDAVDVRRDRRRRRVGSPGKTADEVDGDGRLLKGAVVMSQPMITNFIDKDRAAADARPTCQCAAAPAGARAAARRRRDGGRHAQRIAARSCATRGAA